MVASATQAVLFGGALGFLTQLYSNGVRQLPVLRSKLVSTPAVLARSKGRAKALSSALLVLLLMNETRELLSL